MTSETMLAWGVGVPGPVDTGPLRAVRPPVPDPGSEELLVRVTGSAVCRTDLHFAEGDLPPKRAPAPSPRFEA